jgi:phosphoglycolate phosphatase-like HAD superfamily hydrolase
MITGDDAYPRKPDPTSVLALLARHRLAPGQCMLIGDRALDLTAGARAGVRTCYFGETPAGVEADLVIHDYGVLLRWLAAK